VWNYGWFDSLIERIRRQPGRHNRGGISKGVAGGDPLRSDRSKFDGQIENEVEN
jgi:hypothetical protein